MRTTRTTVLVTALAAAVLIPQADAHPATPQADSVRSALPRTAAAQPGQARSAARSAPVRLGACDSGQLCLWEKPDFTGARQIHELSTVGIESCVPLRAGSRGQALVNRTGRPVTTYQSAECAETGEFETYPGGGTWVPRSPYQVRAFKVWEN